MSGLSELPSGVAVLSWQQEYTAAHNFKATTLTDAATIAWDLSSNQVANVTLAGNRTLSNPTYAKDGGVYILFVKQDATGGRTLGFGDSYRFPNNASPPINSTPNRTSILTFISFEGKMFGAFSLNYFP